MLNITIKQTQFLGYLSALTSAFLWALVTIFYKNIGRKVSPIGMNIGKSIIATLCIAILLFISGFKAFEYKVLFPLIISGILGISLGDTLFFIAINRLSPTIAMLMTTLIPIITVVFSILFLHENPSAKCWIGSIITITGIVIVLAKKKPKGFIKNNHTGGIIYSLLSSICCAASIIFSKLSLSSISALEASFIRHLSGLIALIICGIISLKIKLWLKPLLIDKILFSKLFFASFLGTFLGTWFCLLGLKFSTASIATILNSTSPLFIVALSYAILKEKVSNISIVGIIIAVIGVCIIITGG
jgi:drug/metabolite transporter (DMT)-like permease